MPVSTRPVPIYVKCPVCGLQIKLDKHVYSGKEFACAKCAAVLVLPKGSARLFVFSFLVFGMGIILAAFVGMVVGPEKPYEAIFLQGNPIPGLISWVTVILFIILAAVGSRRMKLQVVRRKHVPEV